MPNVMPGSPWACRAVHVLEEPGRVGLQRAQMHPRSGEWASVNILTWWWNGMVGVLPIHWCLTGSWSMSTQITNARPQHADGTGPENRLKHYNRKFDTNIHAEHSSSNRALVRSTITDSSERRGYQATPLNWKCAAVTVYVQGVPNPKTHLQVVGKG